MRGPLGLGALGQRRHAADGVVAAGQVGQLLGRRRPAPADVGVVRLDVVGRRRRAVGHHHHAQPVSAVTCRPSVVHELDHPLEHAGSVSGSTPWPRLKMWPGRPALRRSTSRARSARPPATARGTPRGRGCPARPCRGRAAGRASSSGTRQSTPTTSAPASAMQRRAARRCRRRSGCGARRGRPRRRTPWRWRAARGARTRRGSARRPS